LGQKPRWGGESGPARAASNSKPGQPPKANNPVLTTFRSAMPAMRARFFLYFWSIGASV
jgi:hypothetical protein